MPFDGSKIRQLRAQRRISRKNLSELTGLSASYIAQIEGEGKNPTYDALESIANAFNISITDLIEDIPSNVVRESPAQYSHEDWESIINKIMSEYTLPDGMFSVHTWLRNQMDARAIMRYTIFKSHAKERLEISLDDMTIKADDELREAILLLLGLDKKDDIDGKGDAE